MTSGNNKLLPTRLQMIEQILKRRFRHTPELVEELKVSDFGKDNPLHAYLWLVEEYDYAEGHNWDEEDLHPSVVEAFISALREQAADNVQSREPRSDHHKVAEDSSVLKHALSLWELPMVRLLAEFNKERDRQEQEEARERERELEKILKAREEELERGRIRDQGCFFSDLRAAADFNHWSEAHTWTFDEAVALSFGKDPTVVSSCTLEDYLDDSPFAQDYAKRLDLALRAEPSKIHRASEPTSPTDFLEWAKMAGIDMPQDLLAEIEVRGIPLVDWKSRCAAAETAFQRLEGETRKIFNDKISPTGRRSLLRLFAGMVYAKYNYNPNSGEPSPATKILGHLNLAGIEIDESTVRDWLAEARPYFPALR